MDKSFQNTGIDFYESLEIIEDKLLEIGALKSKNKEGYLDAFQSLLSNDEVWKSYYESYLSLEKTSLKGFNLKFNRFKFLGICSNIDPRFEDIKLNSTYVQKYLFNQFVHKPFDDNNLLDGLMLFTDFKDDYLRYNMTYFLLLNVEKKYGIDGGTSN
ncbi:MAG: hypothetical protein ABJN84_14330 [Flavobacteriaceae bacterium]